MRQWIYQKCQLEKPGGQGPEDVFTINSSLFLLLQSMHERQEALGKILATGFSRHAPVEQLLFGGCYLAATGRGEGDRTQAFMAGVLLDRLAEGQSCVYWTDEVRRREARLERLINTGWSVLVVVLLLAGALAAYVFLFQ
jgi:hypothetical protein